MVRITSKNNSTDFKFREVDILNSFEADRIIKNALEEDIGSGDITTSSTVDENTYIEGSFIAKEKGVVCGMQILKRVFELIDESIKIDECVSDGENVESGRELAVIRGKAASVLTGERVALNFLQRLSGIATMTRELSDKIKGTKAVVIDTRKTTPGLRLFEKYAVRVGGGANHRYNLADGVLIKDNHIAAAGGIRNAVERCRARVPHLMKIEVETGDFEQVREALDAGAEVIMLDNMSIEEMREAVMLINGRAVTEASGNMGDKDLREVALTGVDLISVGALTHSVKAMDISLRFKT